MSLNNHFIDVQPNRVYKTYLYIDLPLPLIPFDIHIYIRDAWYCFHQCTVLRQDMVVYHKDL